MRWSWGTGHLAPRASYTWLFIVSGLGFCLGLAIVRFWIEPLTPDQLKFADTLEFYEWMLLMGAQTALGALGYCVAVPHLRSSFGHGRTFLGALTIGTVVVALLLAPLVWLLSMLGSPLRPGVGLAMYELRQNLLIAINGASAWCLAVAVALRSMETQNCLGPTKPIVDSSTLVEVVP